MQGSRMQGGGTSSGELRLPVKFNLSTVVYRRDYKQVLYRGKQLTVAVDVMMLYHTLVSLAALAWIAKAESSGSVLVTTAQGRLRGSKLKTYTEKSFFGFRGVRYAEPPTGDYRFKPPVPVRPWGEEIKDATTDGPVCPQPYAEDIGPISSEDCLFLNVYSKELSKSARQPVMMFLHPGGYAGVTGNSYWDGPQYLLDKDIVLVTINYRLGALGFVSTADNVLPGNYGMKDQVEALKWVQQNIASFGGDPSKVTLFGYSAGGASVMLHMISPLSRGLFHRAIAMSGSVTSGWALNKHPQVLAARLASGLGCPTLDSRLIYGCLMRHSAEEIINASIPIKDFEFGPIALFAPVVEAGSDSDRFLPTNPLELIRSGHIAKVPLITGITRDEFAARGYYILENQTLTEEFNERYYTVAPVEFMYEKKGQQSRRISTAIEKFYLDGQPISNATRNKFMEIYTDSLITFSVVQAARLLAVTSSEPVYFYMFDYQGRFSHNYIPGTQTPLGIAHHDELIYLFYISKLFPEFNSTDPDATMVRTLTSIWTGFADTGVPTTGCEGGVWQPLKKGQDRYLRITSCPQMVSGVPFPRRMAFWETNFPLTGPRQENY